MDGLAQTQSTTAASVPPRGDHAARRLARYFESFGLTEPRRIEALVADALARAGTGGAADGRRDGDPATAALETAEARVAAWFGRILGRGEGDGAERPAVMLAGRAAFLLCDGPARWPDGFLRDPPPDALVAAMRAAAAEAEPTPPPEPSAMPAQNLAFWSPAGLLPPWFVRPAHAALGLLLHLAHGR